MYRFTLKEDLVIHQKHDFGRKKLFRDEKGKVWLILDRFVIRVKQGYAWDGCSPKWKIGKRFIGTPDFSGTEEASCVHDALYQFLFLGVYERKTADRVFFELLQRKAKKWIANTYFGCVSVFGGAFYALGSFFKERKGSWEFAYFTPQEVVLVPVLDQ